LGNFIETSRNTGKEIGYVWLERKRGKLITPEPLIDKSNCRSNVDENI
jgi:hypothetical protein